VKKKTKFIIVKRNLILLLLALVISVSVLVYHKTQSQPNESTNLIITADLDKNSLTQAAYDLAYTIENSSVAKVKVSADFKVREEIIIEPRSLANYKIAINDLVNVQPDIRDVLVTKIQGGLQLSDIARKKKITVPQGNTQRFNGRAAISLQIIKAPKNLVRIIEKWQEDYTNYLQITYLQNEQMVDYNIIVSLGFLVAITLLLHFLIIHIESLWRQYQADGDEDFISVKGFILQYIKIVDKILDKPFRPIFALAGVVIVIIVTYNIRGQASTLLPNMQTNTVKVKIRARADLSLMQKDSLTQKVEDVIVEHVDDIENIKSMVGGFDADVIGEINVKFSHIVKSQDLDEMRKATDNLYGMIVEVEKPKAIFAEKDIALTISSNSRSELILETAYQILNFMHHNGDFIDVSDNLPNDVLHWELVINHKLAAKYSIDSKILEKAIALISDDGLALENSNNSVLILPEDKRSFSDLENIKIMTANGNLMRVSDFVTRRPQQNFSINNAQRFNIQANIKNNAMQQMMSWLEEVQIDPAVEIKVAGHYQTMQIAKYYLAAIYILTLLLIGLVSFFQFRSFNQVVIIPLLVIFSIIGVLPGLLITMQPFSIIVGGVAVLLLSVIVAMNNLCFIKTFRRILKEDASIKEALMRTSSLYMRPILLSSSVVIIALWVMAFTTEFFFLWQFAIMISGGLILAVLLELFLTPLLLALGHRANKKGKK
jgi:multidrug efflux pump subunit AcrB